VSRTLELLQGSRMAAAQIETMSAATARTDLGVSLELMPGAVRLDQMERTTMKLYYSPGACSLADHIALHQAGLSFEHEKVDLKAKRTEGGADFTTINPKGYVPVLTLDSGQTLTENIAILDWVAHQNEALRPSGAMGHSRLVEALAFISTEIHKSFKPFFAGAGDEEKKKAGELILKRMSYLAETMKGDFLFGAEVSVADCYLFVMLLWAGKNGLEVPAKLVTFRERMMELPSVQKAMTHEGLI
jgi:glutathione S-transferase